MILRVDTRQENPVRTAAGSIGQTAIGNDVGDCEPLVARHTASPSTLTGISPGPGRRLRLDQVLNSEAISTMARPAGEQLHHQWSFT
jgi:hypothetical protein